MRASAVYYGAGMADAHRIQVEGPIAYPGGKDGSFQASCIAGDWTSDFDIEVEVRKSGLQHAQEKNAVLKLKAIDQDAVQRITLRVAVELLKAGVQPRSVVLTAINNIRHRYELDPLTEDMVESLQGL